MSWQSCSIQSLKTLFITFSVNVKVRTVRKLQNVFKAKNPHSLNPPLAQLLAPTTTESRNPKLLGPKTYKINRQPDKNPQIMGRLHSNGKGISASAIPYSRTPPAWLKVTPEQVVDQICKLAKKGATPSQIGVVLRDSHGVAQVKVVTGEFWISILIDELKAGWVWLGSVGDGE